MSHLGERVAALVDGELDHDSRDRAVAHLARCEECRSAVSEQRWLKSRMRELAATEPSAALRSSLFEIGRSRPAGTDGQAAIRHDETVAAMSPPTRSYLVPHLPTPGPPPGAAADAHANDRRTTDRRRRAGLVMAGAGSVGAAVLGLSYALGGASESPSPSPVSPPVGQFSAEFAGSSDGLPFSVPAVDAYSVSLRTGAGGGHR
jgi:hypothetical protein